MTDVAAICDAADGRVLGLKSPRAERYSWYRIFWGTPRWPSTYKNGNAADGGVGPVRDCRDSHCSSPPGTISTDTLSGISTRRKAGHRITGEVKDGSRIDRKEMGGKDLKCTVREAWCRECARTMS
jgi:hypothetical protein